jgi:hypothetical protein
MENAIEVINVCMESEHWVLKVNERLDIEDQYTGKRTVDWIRRKFIILKSIINHI